MPVSPVVAAICITFFSLLISFYGHDKKIPALIDLQTPLHSLLLRSLFDASDNHEWIAAGHRPVGIAIHQQACTGDFVNTRVISVTS